MIGESEFIGVEIGTFENAHFAIEFETFARGEVLREPESIDPRHVDGGFVFGAVERDDSFGMIGARGFGADRAQIEGDHGGEQAFAMDDIVFDGCVDQPLADALCEGGGGNDAGVVVEREARFDFGGIEVERANMGIATAFEDGDIACGAIDLSLAMDEAFCQGGDALVDSIGMGYDEVDLEVSAGIGKSLS